MHFLQQQTGAGKSASSPAASSAPQSSSPHSSGSPSSSPGASATTATAASATNQTSKIDCAKECPCGVPAIPVPDQWLEVMVTGGFKVWHIIFIIIAFVVTIIVVYCCFHRCRIPRTKQEIEADLMRAMLAEKFRTYLQELPSESTTFMEALKKVQEMEEKSEQDDAQYGRDLTARKRMGWLKLKGKDKTDKPAEGGDERANKDKEAAPTDETAPVEAGKAPANGSLANATDPTATETPKTTDHVEVNMEPLEAAKEEPNKRADESSKEGKKRVKREKKLALKETKHADKHKRVEEQHLQKTDEVKTTVKRVDKVKSVKLHASSVDKREKPVEQPLIFATTAAGESVTISAPTEEAGGQAAEHTKSTLIKRRKAKPNLARTKGTREKHHTDSADALAAQTGPTGGAGEQLALAAMRLAQPSAAQKHHHHHHRHYQQEQRQQQQQQQQQQQPHELPPQSQLHQRAHRQHQRARFAEPSSSQKDR